MAERNSKVAAQSRDLAQKVAARHPAQRFNAPDRGPSLLLHLVSFASFVSNLLFLYADTSHISVSYGWHFQFLTNLGLGLATVTMAVAILADLSLSTKLFFVKNTMAVLVVPLEWLITIMYWGLRAIDTKLVVQEGIELNNLADIGFHLVPTLVLTIDLLYFSPPYTIAAFPAVVMSTVFATGYWFWIELCYSHNGWYPYPIMDALNYPSRGALFAGSALITTVNAMILRWLYLKVNPSQREKLS